MAHHHYENEWIRCRSWVLRSVRRRSWNLHFSGSLISHTNCRVTCTQDSSIKTNVQLCDTQKSEQVKTVSVSRLCLCQHKRQRKPRTSAVDFPSEGPLVSGEESTLSVWKQWVVLFSEPFIRRGGTWRQHTERVRLTTNLTHQVSHQIYFTYSSVEECMENVWKRENLKKTGRVIRRTFYHVQSGPFGIFTASGATWWHHKASCWCERRHHQLISC